MNTGKTYALLTAVGVYEDNIPLSCAGKDLKLMTEALQKGLKLEQDNIRCLGEDGTVTTHSFARSISEFSQMLKKEDTFIMIKNRINIGQCFIIIADLLHSPC